MSDQSKTTASNPELGINVFDLGMLYGQQLHEDGVVPWT